MTIEARCFVTSMVETCTRAMAPLHLQPAITNEKPDHMHPVLLLIITVIDIYFYLLIAMVILSWLVAFNIVNLNNQFVRQVQYFLHRLTEPLLGPIRRFLPDLGGIDLSPVVLLIGVMFLRNMIIYYGPQLLAG
jgi:YggT family protein